jgi:uncharacterized membrane protein HdeD (DUF308 family)
MSRLWTLSTGDFLKGGIVAVISGILTFFVDLINTGALTDLNVNMIGGVAIACGISYILKNFSTDENGKILKKIDTNK